MLVKLAHLSVLQLAISKPEQVKGLRRHVGMTIILQARFIQTPRQQYQSSDGILIVLWNRDT